jgi:hypothetical protein
MKNPFIKQDNNTAWTVAAIAGTVAAVTIAWLFFQGTSRAAKNALAAAERASHANDYLKPKHVKHKKTTDLHDLAMN